jgi:hypothetical protein
MWHSRGLRVTVIGVALAIGLNGLVSGGRATAAKPGGGGGGTTHTSTISYYFQGTHFQMFEDGASKTQVLPFGEDGNPSRKVYGGSRWWIRWMEVGTEGRQELCAFRNDGTTVQVTDTATNPVVFLGGGLPRWSNDQLDSFVTFNAKVDLEGGVDKENYLFRLPVNVADFSAIGNGTKPRLTGDDMELVLDHPPGNQFQREWDYAWSSDPLQFAYIYSDDVNDNTIAKTIVVRTLTEDGPIDVGIHSAFRMNFRNGPADAWAPDGSRIAFMTSNGSDWGGVWTINPDGSNLVQVLRNSNLSTYFTGGWSPNSSELLIGHNRYSNKPKAGSSYWDKQLARMPAGGGQLTVLTSDLPTAHDKLFVGWFAYP